MQRNDRVCSTKSLQVRVLAGTGHRRQGSDDYRRGEYIGVETQDEGMAGGRDGGRISWEAVSEKVL